MTKKKDIQPFEESNREDPGDQYKTKGTEPIENAPLRSNNEETEEGLNESNKEGRCTNYKNLSKE